MSTLKFGNVYINNYYAFLGSLLKKPSIASNVDKVIDDFYVGEKSTEEAESEYQHIAVSGLLQKTKLKENNIDLLIGGDLQNQILASNWNASRFNIPFLGVFSACSSFIESIIISSSMVESKLISNSICVTSSNNLVSEKQYRFPIEYGALRKKCNSFTATGSCSCLISSKKSNIKVESATIGKVITLGHCDTNDMGACMAPAVAETLYEHLKSTNRLPSYYDIILTGDLGIYGLFILKEYMLKKYKMEFNNINDAGILFYDVTPTDNFAGASGPICAPTILFTKMIKKYKKILVIGSGALHTITSANLKKEMPGIGHAISLEVTK